ncbi:hypothetical protein OSB04_028794 [Centaurea solstitialis]|uniref:Disease resistance protein At4g27190-like leucine-rich repeats domain-containing protein n=1 Tax=Centaurea solstitialis TaxID=347529 RepID=A0AA38T184_9ASTR|nr:hypothetical protein OSB04_028794 [Centaurea solstitialis]
MSGGDCRSRWLVGATSGEGGESGRGFEDLVEIRINIVYQVGVSYWFPYQHLKTIIINHCDALLTVIPSHAIGHMPKLENLDITMCSLMREIFEMEGVNKDVGDNPNMGEGSGDTSTIPRPINTTSLELPNLKTLCIYGCDSLEFIFTSSVLESLKKLEKLSIMNCNALQVIGKEDNGEQIIGLEDVVFPLLMSLTLIGLPNLKGFFLGKNDLQWPSLDEVKIFGCPQLMIFTHGRSMAPKLKYMNTGLGKHSLECGLNFDWTNTFHEKQLCNSGTCSAAADVMKLFQYPWSFSNLVELDINIKHQLCWENIKTFFPCNEFLELQNLVKPDATQDIEEETNDDELMETQPADDHLTLISQKNQVMSMDPPTASSTSTCIWKGNWWMPSKLSNLTKVSIDYCHYLEHVFSYGLVASLVQLQELHISDCSNMKVIVEQVQDSETKANEVSFPRLKSLKLRSLTNLKGFFMGSEAFQWPSLDALMIDMCPSMTVFTNGRVTTPKLNVTETKFGLCDATEDVNSFMRIKIQEHVLCSKTTMKKQGQMILRILMQNYGWLVLASKLHMVLFQSCCGGVLFGQFCGVK